MKRSLAVLAAGFIVGLTSMASAHVTIQPNEAQTGSFSRFVVRVPNERDDASTTKVTVTFPDLVFVSFQPKEGWDYKVKMRKLDEPIEVFGTKYDEVIDTVTWSGGKIGPGEFDEFGFSARMPDEAGSLLEFKAEQTYSSGEVVKWAGAPDSEEPAPLLTVVNVRSETEQGPLAILAAVVEDVARQDEMMDSMHEGDSDDGEDDDSSLPLILGGLGSVLGAAALGLTLGKRKV